MTKKFIHHRHQFLLLLLSSNIKQLEKTKISAMLIEIKTLHSITYYQVFFIGFIIICNEDKSIYSV